MNILLFTGVYDTKPASGGAFLMKLYVEELRRQGHKVLVYYFSSADANPKAATNEPDTYYLGDMKDKYFAQKPIYIKAWGKINSLLGKGPKPEPDKLKRYFERDFSWLGEMIADKIAASSIDVVQVDFPWMMKLGTYLPAGILKIYVSHEAQFVLYERQGDIEMARRSKQYEMALAAQYQAVLTLTDVEAAIWRAQLPGIPVYNSPMGIELPEKGWGIAPRAHKLVFVGSGKHAPNLDGIRYFFSDIWPLLQVSHPELMVEITGEYNDVFMAEFAQVRGLVWVGFVAELGRQLHGAISIVPVRLGSGIRVKILESMALGAPVVSTLMAAEGIAAKHNDAILLAADAHQFAQAIDRLIHNEEDYRRIAGVAHQFVYEHYELAVSTQKRIALLQSIIN